MNCSAANLHGGNRVQYPDSTLKWLEIRILVRKYAKSALVDAKANTGMNVLFCRLEPSITRSLCDRKCEYRQPGREEASGNADLLEDVMEKCVVAIVIHAPEY